MNQKKTKGHTDSLPYETPQVEVIEVKVEQGFQLSSVNESYKDEDYQWD